MKLLLSPLLCSLAFQITSDFVHGDPSERTPSPNLGSQAPDAMQTPEATPKYALRSRGGVPVKIALSREFEPSEEFNGFLKESTGSSVLLHQSDRRGLSAALDSFTNAKFLGRQRRKLIEKGEKESYQGYDAYRIELKQEIPGAPEARIVSILLFGDEDACCTAQASWYEERGKDDVEALRTALNTVVWDRPVIADPFEGFTWDLQYARGKQFRLLKHAQTLENVVVYTDNGQVDFENTGRPLLVAQRVPNAPKLTLKPLEQFEDKPEDSEQTGERPIGAPAVRNGDAALSPEQRQLRDAQTEYAKSRLHDVPGLEDLNFDEVRYFSIAGMNGIEILASATEALPEVEGETDEPEAAPESPLGGMFPPSEEEGPRTISLYELVVFGRGEHAEEHWVMNGRIWQRIGKNWMKEFQKASRTFRVLPKTDAEKESQGATPEASGKEKSESVTDGVKVEKGSRGRKGD